jgi:hypothetical protein
MAVAGEVDDVVGSHVGMFLLTENSYGITVIYI